MDLSVILPTLGRSPATPTLLASLAAQDLGWHAVELVVVADGKTIPDLPPLPFPSRVLRHARNRGRAAACNTGARAASGRLLLFLDDDLVLLRKDHLAAHAEAHGEAPSAVLGRVSIAPGLPPGPWSLFVKTDVDRVNGLKRRSPILDPMLCETGNCSLPRDLFLDAGGFDEGMRLYGCEDFELGLRLAGKGIPLLFRDDLAVLHKTDMVSLSTVARKSFGRGFNAVRVSITYPERARSLGVAPYLENRISRLKALIHHVLYPAWIPLAHVAEAAGWTAACVLACHRIAFTWRLRGILAALRSRACV